MVDRVDLAAPPSDIDPSAGAGGDNGAPARPDWLPAEFASVEDFAKSYADTKAELTRKSQALAALQKPADPAPGEGEQPAPKPDDGKPKTAEGKALEIADEEPPAEGDTPSIEFFAPYRQEFIQTGDVAPENRSKIAERLKPLFGDMAEAVVNDYIEGSKVRRDNVTRELMDAAGGNDQYTAMVAWAKDNLSPAEKEAYNRQVNSGDVHSAKFAIEGLRAKFEKVNGRAPNLVTGNGDIAPSTAAFKSVQEMTKAMMDPRYKTDAAYRKSVEQRVAISNI